MTSPHHQQNCPKIALLYLRLWPFSTGQITAYWQLVGLVNIFRPRASLRFSQKEIFGIEVLDSSCKWWADALGSAAAVEEGFEGHNGVHASPPLVECTMMKGWGGARGRRGGWKMSPVTIHVSRVRGSDPHNLVFLPKLPIGAAVTPGMTCHGEWNSLGVWVTEMENLKKIIAQQQGQQHLREVDNHKF